MQKLTTFQNAVNAICGLWQIYNCLFVPNLSKTFLLLAIDKQLCDACYRELAQKFKDQPQAFYGWLHMRRFVMYWRYTCIINLIILFWKPVNFIALKLCVLAIKLRIHFDFSLVLIFFRQKNVSSHLLYSVDNISMNFSKHPSP